MPIPEQINVNPRVTAKERIFHTLQQWIIDGTLEPDERLNDMELARHFSVSRTPVREALQLLCEQKLVYIVPSSGTYVAPIDKEDIRHVYQLLAGLHALAVGFCIDKVTEEDLVHLSSVNETFYKRARSGNATAANEADSEFHRHICKLSGNPYLLNFSDQLTVQASRNENQFFKGSSKCQDSYECHKRIIQALKDRDLPTAQREISSNWLNSIPESN